MRMLIRPCFEFTHCQLGAVDVIETRVNETRFTVCEFIGLLFIIEKYFLNVLLFPWIKIFI